MARQLNSRDLSTILAAGRKWIDNCLLSDGSVFSNDALWTSSLAEEVHRAFVDRPDFSKNDFMTKLRWQMGDVSPPVQHLAAEMLWGLLLFPSNVLPPTKRRQVMNIWSLSEGLLPEEHPMLTDQVLLGIGSGGPGFNNYRPNELAFLIAIVKDLKLRDEGNRRQIFSDYDAFIDWIESVPRQGFRQFRHMLRYFAFPEIVERMSSNNDRFKILEAFGVVALRESRNWTDRQLDNALLALRGKLQQDQPSVVLDFYEHPLKERWAQERKIRTITGEITVVVPDEENDYDEQDVLTPLEEAIEERPSIQMQAMLAEIGAAMGFRVWIPRSDRVRVSSSMSALSAQALLNILPLNYNEATISTIEQIDVIWLRNGSIARAFEVEHTTAVYSGLLRMADLLALQPNMNIRLHIVAPDERRDKVFREMKRPVFTLLERGPLSEVCSFLSYDSVEALASNQHLRHLNQSIIEDYDEHPDQS